MTNHNDYLGDFDEFVVNNMNLVHKICNKYRKYIQYNPQVGTYEDMVSVGSIGLIKAYKNFNPTLGEGIDGTGIKFSTYGVPMIIGEIQRAIRDSSVGVRFSRSYKEAYSKVYTADMTEEEPKVIMEKLDMSNEEVEKAMQYYRHCYPQYLDEEVREGDGDPITLGDMIEGNKVDFDSKIALTEFLDTLSSRRKECITMHIKEFNQREIAAKLGVSQAQISRIIVDVFTKAEQYSKIGTSFSKKAG